MIKVAIIGASGYTGLELIKILINHPKFEISYIANSEGGTTLTSLHRSLKNVYEIDVQKANPQEIAKYAELAFLALPHKASMGMAKELIQLGMRVVDLSADYRLELETYEAFYCLHEDKENLPQAVYGLPEFYKQQIANANLVANPGCYPTASLLGVLPFVDFIKEDANIFVDAKSGVSGAGKKLAESSHYVTINENIFAYNPIKHRHAPEIHEKILKIAHKNTSVHFVPHLLPVTRGMLISIYVELDKVIEDPIAHLKEFYKNQKFIRIMEEPVDIKSSSGTNFCDIYAKCNKNIIFISSAIDNLLRGASSQAVVNANIMYGFDEELAIPMIAYVP